MTAFLATGYAKTLT